jgi:hypothetical protein
MASVSTDMHSTKRAVTDTFFFPKLLDYIPEHRSFLHVNGMAGSFPVERVGVPWVHLHKEHEVGKYKKKGGRRSEEIFVLLPHYGWRFT